MRTTVDIDTPILKDLKRLQRREGKSLGRLVSELLAEAMGRRKAPAEKAQPLRWNTTAGKPLVDFADKEALYETVDADHVRTPPR
ncbi:MAG: antitoxin [Deltaproteobacteria bacterium]|nr:antitoxin [Deltaproteobacteria bacterium]